MFKHNPWSMSLKLFKTARLKDI